MAPLDQNRSHDAPAVPPGTPAWVTPELLAATLDVWQPHFQRTLQPADAVEILMNVGHLLDALEERNHASPSGPQSNHP